MPQITSNFIFRSKLPNFERDSFDTMQAMRDVDPSWIDEGHISYCKADGIHYKFSQESGWDINTGYWRVLTPTDLVISGYITQEELDEILNEYAKGFEVDEAIEAIRTETSNANNTLLDEVDEKIKEAKASWEDIAHRNYVHKSDLNEKLENCITDDSLTEKLKDYVTEESLTETLTDYAKISDIPGVEDGKYITVEEADSKYAAKNSTDGFEAEIKANQKAIKELSDELDEIKPSILTKEEADNKYVAPTDLSSTEKKIYDRFDKNREEFFAY